MSTQQNPFSTGYKAIYDSLQAWPALASAVKVRNFRTLQEPGYKPRTEIAAADRPELLLLERRIRTQALTRDSLGWFAECLYPLQIASGRLGIDAANLLTTQVIQALTSAGPFLGLDKSDVIHKWEFADASLVARDVPTERPDWTVVAGINVTFAIDRKTFLATTFT